MMHPCFQINNNSALSLLTQKMNEGGVFFMYTLLAILLLILSLIVKTSLQKKKNQQLISQINAISLFALVFGFLGQIIGMIQVFDAIQFDGNISPEIMGRGLKITSLPPAFGMIVFLIGRLGTMILTVFKNKHNCTPLKADNNSSKTS